MSTHVLIPIPQVESEVLGISRQSIGTPVPISELDGHAVLSFGEGGPTECEDYTVREVTEDIVSVTTNRATYLLPASMPVAVSGVIRSPKPDVRAVDTGIDLSRVHKAAGWILAAELGWNDGLFWAPEFGSEPDDDRVDGDEDAATAKPRLRWIEVVQSVSPHSPKKADSRLQVLTAPSYFVASGDHDPYGILVSGVVTVSPLQVPEEPDGQAQTSTTKRRTTKKKTV